MNAANKRPVAILASDMTVLVRRFTPLAQIENAVHASEQVVFGDAAVNLERIKQAILRSTLASHHQHLRIWFGQI